MVFQTWTGMDEKGQGLTIIYSETRCVADVCPVCFCGLPVNLFQTREENLLILCPC